MAGRRYQKGQVTFNTRRQVWLGRYYEDIAQPDGSTVRKRPRVVLGTKKELPTRPLAMRRMDAILSRINDYSYRPVLISTVSEFAKEWREKVLARRKPSTIRSTNSHLNHYILPQLGRLRLDQVGPENQQVFVNQLTGCSRKTALNVLSTLNSMLTCAESWGYATRKVEVRKLVLPDRNEYIAPYFTRPQLESILRLAQDPWRTFFVLIALTGMRAGEILGLQWQDIDFDKRVIHIRRSVWCGRVQSTKSAGSAAPVAMPDPLEAVLQTYRAAATGSPDGFLFVTRNGRPPSSNKVVEYQLWPLLDALGIPRCGLHAFRHSVATLIAELGHDEDAARQQLRHSDIRTTRGYIHRPGNAAEKAITDLAASLNLDTVGHELPPKPQYIQ